jgi:hypothetical protein
MWTMFVNHWLSEDEKFPPEEMDCEKDLKREHCNQAFYPL